MFNSTFHQSLPIPIYTFAVAFALIFVALLAVILRPSRQTRQTWGLVTRRFIITSGTSSGSGAGAGCDCPGYEGSCCSSRCKNCGLSKAECTATTSDSRVYEDSAGWCAWLMDTCCVSESEKERIAEQREAEVKNDLKEHLTDYLKRRTEAGRLFPFEEFVTLAQQHGKDVGPAADTDVDGRICLEEFMAAFVGNPFTSAADANFFASSRPERHGDKNMQSHLLEVKELIMQSVDGIEWGGATVSVDVYRMQDGHTPGPGTDLRWEEGDTLYLFKCGYTDNDYILRNKDTGMCGLVPSSWDAFRSAYSHCLVSESEQVPAKDLVPLWLIADMEQFVKRSDNKDENDAARTGPHGALKWLDNSAGAWAGLHLPVDCLPVLLFYINVAVCLLRLPEVTKGASKTVLAIIRRLQMAEQGGYCYDDLKGTPNYVRLNEYFRIRLCCAINTAIRPIEHDFILLLQALLVLEPRVSQIKSQVTAIKQESQQLSWWSKALEESEGEPWDWDGEGIPSPDSTALDMLIEYAEKEKVPLSTDLGSMHSSDGTWQGIKTGEHRTPGQQLTFKKLHIYLLHGIASMINPSFQAALLELVRGMSHTEAILHNLAGTEVQISLNARSFSTTIADTIFAVVVDPP